MMKIDQILSYITFYEKKAENALPTLYHSMYSILVLVLLFDLRTLMVTDPRRDFHDIYMI